MRTKTRFFWTAVITVIALIIILLLLNTLPPIMSFSDGISLYGVIIDISAGIFTVWGLYWAASGFSEAQVKPDLSLIIGAANRILPLPVLEGQDNIHSGRVCPPVSQIVFGLSLENGNSKAAQFVRITLRLRDSQRPLKFEAIEKSFQYYKPRVNTVQQEAIFLQFGEDLVVYKGDGVYLGNVCVEWDQGERPERLTLEVGLYNLIGEPKTVIVSRPINWN
jgi:hypothetical protein